LSANGHDERMPSVDRREEPEAQVLPERELMLLVAPDAAPGDLPPHEPDEAEEEED
jgi:hypothetical protein